MRSLVAVLLLSLSFSLFAEPIEQFDAKLDAELANHPTILAVWKQANAARAAGRHEEAIALYAQVAQRMPSFDHALRRQAGEELQLKQRDAALLHARQALTIQHSTYNLSMLAIALSIGEPKPEEIEEAKSLANEAVAVAPNESIAYSALAQVAATSQDIELLRTASQKLDVLAPNEPETHTIHAMVAATDGEWDAAQASLDRARALGLPEESYTGLRDSFRSAMPFYVRWWKAVAGMLAIWFGGFALLLLAGAILSRVAMRAAANTSNEMSSTVRRLYAIVLGTSCGFYYASIPLVLAFVLAFCGGLIYATFVLGHVPVKIVIILVVVAGVSVWSMLKSLFMRRSDEDPGTRLDLAAHPKMRALLDTVAQRIGTRAVDNVYLTPGTDVAVMERGKRNKERCLILGIAALDGLMMRPFKAILGHEYGHFTNRDTAGGAFALAVRNSLTMTAVGLAQGGVATWYNPAWWFVNGFHRVFLRISEGASRLQEVLADRWAVSAYGADAFEQGLRHVVERGVRFDAHVGATLKEVVDGKLPLTNLYAYAPNGKVEDVTEAVAEAIERKSSAYDSHPAPAERFALVHALPANARTAEADDDLPAWSLFADAEALQHLMTAQVRENVRARYGVEITAG